MADAAGSLVSVSVLPVHSIFPNGTLGHGVIIGSRAAGQLWHRGPIGSDPSALRGIIGENSTVPTHVESVHPSSFGSILVAVYATRQ